ncbi:LOW QUALITY PROTEIN: hypothetical protein SAMD00019534_110860 [Acytostelium subglobosum LB1]|uniref:hypothetical protein n=1 Tax=Acytostelium subglobosum LB1 TaxID=1410327 RepID=UPI000644C126|nr:LOW QUALITY PROTEIN: hypothetical protein SAMD00019534_110860 [Acytostelium subglobosum LB1]GAM27910.1 hypothetical protein SAMD00019534_110860 [Acytostelium subglobosum LB1]|eukprot:XP_012749193.1 LOW QUALITY PROTEIN: hypothetical protein SAMD00019534_110860 [Acytostelium subglobosum LB1]
MMERVFLYQLTIAQLRYSFTKVFDRLKSYCHGAEDSSAATQDDQGSCLFWQEINVFFGSVGHCDIRGKIVYVGKTEGGAQPDVSLYKDAAPRLQALFDEDIVILGDKGFKGGQKYYTNTITPKIKSASLIDHMEYTDKMIRKRTLDEHRLRQGKEATKVSKKLKALEAKVTKEGFDAERILREKDESNRIKKVRIIIENVFGEMKKWNILSDTIRSLGDLSDNIQRHNALWTIIAYLTNMFHSFGRDDDFFKV